MSGLCGCGCGQQVRQRYVSSVLDLFAGAGGLLQLLADLAKGDT